jgi:hypothetical protein
MRLAYEALKGNSNGEYTLLAPRIPFAVRVSREDAWTQHAGCSALAIRSSKKHVNDK